MKTIGLDGASIDYLNIVFASRRGLRNRFGIRVLEDRCYVIIQIGDDQPNTFGNPHPIPVQLEILPGYVRMIVDDNVLNDPGSDLVDVLTGNKSFQQALIRCPECVRLTDLLADLLKENAELLREYHMALRACDKGRVEKIIDALPGIEQFRKMAKEQMEAHRATHDKAEGASA